VKQICAQLEVLEAKQKGDKTEERGVELIWADGTVPWATTGICSAPARLRLHIQTCLHSMGFPPVVRSAWEGDRRRGGAKRSGFTSLAQTVTE